MRVQFCLKPHSIKGLHTKLWASKVMGVHCLSILGVPIWEPETKWHLDVGPMARHKKYYKGRWRLPPSPSRGEFCESMFARDSSVHQKCSNYALINLLFGLCKLVWIIEKLVIRLNPILELQHAPLLPIVAR
jgi:hypothetical protein